MKRDNSLLAYLPDGEAAWVHRANGTWGVDIFKSCTIEILCKVADGMDKCVAAWLAVNINEALEERREKNGRG